MKNIYVEEMRKVLVSYRELMKLTNEAMEKNKERYSPRIAEEYNSVLREKKVTDYGDAVAEIGKIFDKIRTLLAKGNFPVPSELTDDKSLFDNDAIELSKSEVEALAQKYADKGNFTMLRLIDTWAKRNGRVDIELKPPAVQLDAYLKFAKRALYVIDSIYSEKMDHFVPLQIQDFGDEITYRYEYEAVGSGEALKQCATKNVPESALHVFDSVKLTNSTQNAV